MSAVISSLLYILIKHHRKLLPNLFNAQPIQHCISFIEYQLRHSYENYEFLRRHYYKQTSSSIEAFFNHVAHPFLPLIQFSFSSVLFHILYHKSDNNECLQVD